METPDAPASGIAALINAVRTVPVWMLAGLAVAGFAVLYLRPFGGVDVASFRTHWGVWIWVGAITCSILACTRGVDAAVAAYRSRLMEDENELALRLFAEPHRCWWHHARQQDDSFVSQISMDIIATNVTDRPVRIVQARLLGPKMKSEILHSDVSLPAEGSLYHSNKHPVPAHDTVRASLHIMIRGSLGPQGQPVKVIVELTDQLGKKYRLRLRLPTHDARLPKVALRQRLLSILRASKTSAEEAPPLPSVWEHGGRFDSVDVVLNEEKRAYAARGRRVGGLGSLNVTLQSEPNFGWTTDGNVPLLLWPKEQAKIIGSQNLATIMKVYDGLDQDSKDALHEYLLSHLNKQSHYADVAYFVFLALHRMNRTLDALFAAQTNLRGDRVYGYSNLLGTLSAIISHEHSSMDPVLYSRIDSALADDPEPNFRLKEKINVARLQHIGAKLHESPSPSAAE